jgi:hypothetical protein
MHLIWLLLLAHVVGDIVLQTDRVFSYKLSHRWGVFLHVGICALAMVAVLFPLAQHWRVWVLLLVVSAWHLLLDWGKGELRRRRGIETLGMFLGDQALHVAGIVGAVGLCCGFTAAPVALPALRAAMVPLDVAIVATALLAATFATAPLVYYLQVLERSGRAGERAPFPTYAERVPGYVERALGSAGAYLGGLGMVALLVLVGRWAWRRRQHNVPATIEAVVGLVACVVSGVGARLLTRG